MVMSHLKRLNSTFISSNFKYFGKLLLLFYSSIVFQNTVTFTELFLCELLVFFFQV